jgi:hypothetical protein
MGQRGECGPPRTKLRYESLGKFVGSLPSLMSPFYLLRGDNLHRELSRIFLCFLFLRYCASGFLNKHNSFTAPSIHCDIDKEAWESQRWV